MTLAGVYGFWKYVSKLDRRETRRYLEMFYILKFRELVSYHPNSIFLCIIDIIETSLLDPRWFQYQELIYNLSCCSFFFFFFSGEICSNGH